MVGFKQSRELIEFVDQLVEGSGADRQVAARVAAELSKLAAVHLRFCELELNSGGLSERWTRHMQALEHDITTLVQKFSDKKIAVEFFGDVRGNSVGLRLPSGAYNSLTGTYKVPVNQLHFRSMAKQPFMYASRNGIEFEKVDRHEPAAGVRKGDYRVVLDGRVVATVHPSEQSTADVTICWADQARETYRSFEEAIEAVWTKLGAEHLVSPALIPEQRYLLTFEAYGTSVDAAARDLQRQMRAAENVIDVESIASPQERGRRRCTAVVRERMDEEQEIDEPRLSP